MNNLSGFEIVVAGSLNMDLVVRAPRSPQAGETMPGTEFATFLGGKGYNQALAAQRAGGRVVLIGKVGQDTFGDEFLAVLPLEGLESRYVGRAPTSTGIASILVEPDGTNRIIVVPGANRLLSAGDVEAAAPAFQGAKVLMLQLETPLESAIAAARHARRAGLKVILTPAPSPAEPLPPELLSQLDLIVPNEVEVGQLTGLAPSNRNPADYPELAAARRLQQMGPPEVIVTLGSRGSLYLNRQGAVQVFPAYRVEVVDTTAAGDAFTGTLATGLARNLPLAEAIRAANAAGAITCTRPGASASLPSAADISRFIQSEPWPEPFSLPQ